MPHMRTFMTIVDVVKYLQNNPSVKSLHAYVHGAGDPITSDRLEHRNLADLLIRSVTPEIVGRLLDALRLPALRTLEISFYGSWPIAGIRSIAAPYEASLRSLKMWGNVPVQSEEILALAHDMPHLTLLWAYSGTQDLVNRDINRLMMTREIANQR
ncbi:hypothetical protein FIBSPDRAFT_576347 [Athelia psychrophila]|uniref:F-box domain-containing protein n=1 Tax=Athelia psychrophila TaxID=1759441 RepID=A0A166UGR2_9AGAM|nr:hypothetical protein FIBSPDRAFT_576347 [Fibularhizoctonia sp. CBS 109695]